MLDNGRRFASVDECLRALPPDERALTERLRELILSEAPGLRERLSFNVPFYRGHREVCFLWPASVLWGARKTYAGVRVGFSQGHLLRTASGYLARGTRKQVHWRDLTACTPEDERLLTALLQEALEVDRERARGLRQGP